MEIDSNNRIGTWNLRSEYERRGEVLALGRNCEWYSTETRVIKLCEANYFFDGKGG